MFLATMILASLAAVENPVAYSANGRFCAVERWYAVPDFTTKWIEEPEQLPDRVTVAWYEVRGRRRITEVSVDVAELGAALVSDSGRYLVGVGRSLAGGGCVVTAPGENELLTSVYRADGSRAGALHWGDVFGPYDLRHLGSGVTYELRRESETQEVLVLGVPGKNVERRIDLATVKLIDEKADIWERPRVSFAPMTAEAATRAFQQESDCAAQFDDPSIVHLDSATFLERARHTPVPDYPVPAYKARISGPVRVRVLVSERGEVLCVRSSPLPFGISEAAREVVRTWTFRPSASAYAGEVLFHFTQ